MLNLTGIYINDGIRGPATAFDKTNNNSKNYINLFSIIFLPLLFPHTLNIIQYIREKAPNKALTRSPIQQFLEHHVAALSTQ